MEEAVAVAVVITVVITAARTVTAKARPKPLPKAPALPPATQTPKPPQIAVSSAPHPLAPVLPLRKLAARRATLPSQRAVQQARRRQPWDPAAAPTTFSRQ